MPVTFQVKIQERFVKMPATFRLKVRNFAEKQERYMKMAVISLLKVRNVTEKEENSLKCQSFSR